MDSAQEDERRRNCLSLDSVRAVSANATRRANRALGSVQSGWVRFSLASSLALRSQFGAAPAGGEAESAAGLAGKGPS